MAETSILVDGKLFLGRVEEQKQFRLALSETLYQNAGEELPYIFLLYGDGGIGKTTLAKRFQDIAQTELSFKDRAQVLWLDWEEERRKFAALQVGREHIKAETVLRVICEVFKRCGLVKSFKAYNDALKMRDEVERKAVEVMSTSNEREQFTELRGASTNLIASALRTGLPIIGEPGERLAKAFLDEGIKISGNRATQLLTAIKARLKARFSPQHYDFYLNPDEQLARALASDLKQIAKQKHLLLLFDTYEIVDRTDIWIRTMIRAAGPQVLWVISGRDDLTKSRQFGNEYFSGYSAEFPRRLLAYDMRQLAIADIRDYFTYVVPQRPLGDSEAEAISRATRGIPLAVSEAAEMWARGTSLPDLVGDINESTPNDQIAQKMSERYLLHAVSEVDKQALFALALALGDVETIRAMLHPPDGSLLNLEARLRTLRRDYASVHAGRARLHDEPALFFREYLKVKELRTEDWLRELIQRAINSLRTRLSKLEADLPYIEDRCSDEDWIKVSLNLTDYLFWLDEKEAWLWLLPRFIESLAYSPELKRGLLRIADSWKNELMKSGQKRLKILHIAGEASPSLEDKTLMLEELTQLARQGWLRAEDEDEYMAILTWKGGQLLHEKKLYRQALMHYKQVGETLASTAVTLRKHIAKDMWKLAESVIWPNGALMPVYSTEGEEISNELLSCLPESAFQIFKVGNAMHHFGRLQQAITIYNKALEIEQRAYILGALGDAYFALGRYEEAFAQIQKALDLAPSEEDVLYHLVNIIIKYQQLGRYEDAFPFFQRAIGITPKKAAAHRQLGFIYRVMGLDKEALHEYLIANEIDPKDFYTQTALAHIMRKLGREEDYIKYIEGARELMIDKSEYDRSCFESICGNVDEAFVLLKLARGKKQFNKDWARVDPDFEWIRNDPRFEEILAGA
jgi:Flp pilus assembly protein TadD